MRGCSMLPANEWRTVTVALDAAVGRVTTCLDGVAVFSVATTVKAEDLPVPVVRRAPAAPFDPSSRPASPSVSPSNSPKMNATCTARAT
ncbi:hypothetical protein ACFYZB_00115 [Streptomyces sp. NPDC001852]|uniref:hypothetical protein n=1 Tax=Streptomyces sp. NPDC001852 TaxID=3364619 RepID=UPI0036B1F66C